MTSDKHTPGPWVVTPEYQNFPEAPAILIMPAEGESYPEGAICDVWGGNHDHKANARLIAAAPDMLEALKNTTAALEYVHGSGWETTNKARAAIAKAETQP